MYLVGIIVGFGMTVFGVGAVILNIFDKERL